MADNKKIVLEMEAKTKKLLAQLKTVKKSMKGVDDQTKRMRISTAGLRRTLGALRNNMLLVTFAFGGSAKAIGSLISAYGKQELAERKLSQALGFTSQALLTQASALQETTTFGDEAIIGVQALIGAFTKDEEQIKELTKTTLDLAAAKGMDLTAAADLVSKSFGSSTNALSRYGIQVEGAVGSSERLENLTGNVAALFGGQAVAQADTMTGSIEQMKNAMGDTAETMGEIFEPATIAVTKTIKSASERLSEFFNKLNETDMETLVRQLRELGIAGDQLTLLDNVIKIEEHTQNWITANEKIVDLLRTQGQGVKNNNFITQDLTKTELELLGVKVKLLSNDRRKVDVQTAELVNEEKIRKFISDRVGLLKELIKGQTSLSKEQLDQKNTYLEQIDFLKQLLKAENERAKAGKALDDVYDPPAKPDPPKLTPEEIFLAQFDEFKKEKDEQLKNYEHEQALIEKLVQDHKDVAEALGLETDAQKDLNKEKEKQERADAAAQKTKEANTKAAIKDFTTIGKLYRQDADKARDAAIDKIGAYAAEAAANQMKKAIATLPFPLNIAVAATAGAGIGIAIHELTAPLKSKKAQYGMDEVVDEPTMILAGEAGAEQVSITPLESPNIDGVQGGGASVVVNVSGNVLTSDFVEGELAENIREAVRRGTDFGIG
tara:strand:- start:1795 stop:3789 length:1995 start_codon:yes stop_codon:yes gene_type:complete